MAKVKIESETNAKIFVDGKEQLQVKKGTFEFDTAEGKHEIYAKAAWCGSPKIEINADESKVILLHIDSFAGESSMKAVIMFIVAIGMFTKNLLFIYFALILFMYPMYYLTFGMNKYIKLEEFKYHD
ncbi:hypothetical protein OAT16_05290 [Prolixibacteraceae bacterium]|nr:hypothetical protein [Prolixibacteraceae bacterium]